MFRRTKISQAVGLALSGTVALAALPASAQEAQRIEITGSSIKRIDVEGALQVQTVTKTEIEQLGVQSTEQLLLTISAIFETSLALISIPSAFEYPRSAYTFPLPS